MVKIVTSDYMVSKLSADQLISDLQAFAEKLGEVPTQTAMNDRGPHSSTPYYNRFGSWNDTAGLRVRNEPRERNLERGANSRAPRVR
ncbi:homing endonuclease associated repeat-containing protein [Haladaptatus cibarius]|uniref:homing endonuclease associated repeat-containing protein n=1 Tax=Haladaptatus cibarius TaxID=453847 RepID=UPI000A6087AC|nr:hypothetical protein [Haladaptatus cibarius]